MYFSTIQSNIIFPSRILLALTLSKQNFMLLSSVPMYLPIPPHYITMQHILIQNCTHVTTVEVWLILPELWLNISGRAKFESRFLSVDV
jgi:hypothetical protein